MTGAARHLNMLNGKTFLNEWTASNQTCLYVSIFNRYVVISLALGLLAAFNYKRLGAADQFFKNDHKVFHIILNDDS